MFIAGAISTFLSQASVMRYLGPHSNRTLAYGVASVSGTVLAVCSCSVLPMSRMWFSREELKQWMRATLDFTLMIIPLLFGGVFLTGFIGALIPEQAVAAAVGGNGLASNFTASFVGMIEEIIKYGVMATPGLVIDEEVKASGRIPQSGEIASWIVSAASRESTR
jgi:uncharacterized membrane protein YraQ (UPF0718 family)